LQRSRSLSACVLLLVAGSLGCWEQWSVEWFPQMKWQRSVQPFEPTGHEGRVDLFLPPDGAIPIDGGEPPVSNLVDAASDRLVNPRSMTLASVENGRAQYQTFCATCHGEGGIGDGPVSMVGATRGPLGGVLPLMVVAGRSDGHVYTTIRYGRRRMPSYARIPSEDRWDIVNYIRFLTKQRGIQP
jgi:cytochrome c553